MESIIHGTNHNNISNHRHLVNNVSFTRQKPEAVSHFLEVIVLILSRWNGLQMAVQNQWGGRDSLQKSHQLAADILSWFCHSKAPLYVEDLENLLHESMLLCFNTDIEDGSIEEVKYICTYTYI
ncbi:WGG domain-containing protein [Cephalotus follicularis]|uniref:WGG domain-containing protein n=1 Tax=Cephalotus follicularis TaxID=3775 RepID=A0A1Q3CNV8_CEPFO|nr:WGG domain-containing protein [Cephalotus follicularis]